MSATATVLLLAATAFYAVGATAATVASSASGASEDFGSEPEPWMNEIFPTLPIVVNGAASVECRRDSALLVAALRENTYWAMQMWDSSARASSSLLSGNVYHFGDFETCLGTRTPFRAGPKYCLVTLAASRRDRADAADSVWSLLTPSNASTLRRRDVVYRGLCVPASCSAHEIQASLGRHLVERRGDVTLTATLDDVDCRVATPSRLDASALTFCGVVSALALVCVAATLYDSYGGVDEDVGWRGYVLCFSLSRNLSALTETPTDTRLDLLHGIRVVTMCLIICDHAGAFRLAGTVTNFTFVEWLYSHPLGLLLQQLDLLVDTFFVLSGLMLAYILSAQDKKRPVGFLQMMVLRYCRLTPPYAMMVFFVAAMLPSVGDGPVWHRRISIESVVCTSNWWTNLLYISNYVNVDNMCMMQGWYLSCDFHFFAAGALLLRALRRHRRLGCALYACALTASVLSVHIAGYDAGGPPVLRVQPALVLQPRVSEVFQSVYIASHHRAGAYLVGMAAGCLLDRTRDFRGTNNWLPKAGVAISLVLLIGTFVVSAPLFKVDADADALYGGVPTTLIAGGRRFSWALGTAVFIVSLVLSEESRTKRALSWWPFVVLSKLLYCAYLVHFPVQFADALSVRDTTYYSFYTLVRVFAGDILWTLLFSLALHLSTEAPLRLIFKRLLQAQPGDRKTR